MLPEGIANVIVAAVTLLIMVYVDWQIALLTLLMVGIGMAASSQMYKAGMDRMGNYFAATKRLNNTIIEYVNGMEVVRVFNRQGEAGEKFRDSVINYRDYALVWYHICWPWMALYGTIFSYTVLYSIPFGALMIVLGHLTLRQYVLALCMSFAVGPLLSHVMSFMGAVPQINYKIQALEKTLDHPPLKSGDQTFSGADHTVSFENVRFAYKSDEVLKGLSFEAKEGEMTALVGESGSGKTTIANLMARFWEVKEGEVLLRGTDIRSLPMDTLMAQISMVFQKVYLFDDTIYNNIAMGRQNASYDEVVEAARKARCYEFIMRLPYGFDTRVGEGGASLSGGEKQRISIARCILKNAPIIILDEATASVDADNEYYIQEAMSELCKDKTVLVIAHRLNTIRSADKIIVLEKGKIIEEGNHETLMQMNGRYCGSFYLQKQMNGWNNKGETS